MGGKLTDLIAIQKEVNADIMSVTEHNTDTTKYHIKSNLYMQCRNNLRTPQLNCSSTPVKSHTNFKPGGTLMVSAGPITARLLNKEEDYLGRWSLQTFGGRKGIQVTVFTCYQIPKCHARRGRYTNQAQQEAYLRKINKPSQNVRQLFYEDLTEKAKELQEKGHAILLVGDFNDDIKDVHSGMAKLISTLKLHDLMRYAVGNTNIATYARGIRRLDYALGDDRFLLSLVQGGYEAFGSRIRTDHRPFYLDFNTKMLFGIEHLRVTENQERWLHSKDTTKVTSYLETLYEKLQGQNVFQRMDKLLQAEVSNHDLLETLDELYTGLALKTERDQRRRYSHEWSNALLKQRAHVNYLQYCIAQSLTGYSHHKSIDHLQTTFGPFSEPISLEDSRTMLSTAQSKLNKLIKECVETREQELRAKIEELELRVEEESKTKAQALRKILRAEELAQLYSKLQRLRRTKKGTLYKLEVPKDPTDNPKSIAEIPEKWEVLETSKDIHKALTERNQKHFGQAEIEKTKFFTEPLNSDINYTATTASTELILDGQYDTSAVDALTATFIEKLEKITDFQAKESLTPEQVKQRIKIWKERTTTSPSGLHLGHYKALQCKHKYSSNEDNDPDRIKFDNIQQTLLRFRTQIINYAIKWGYCIRRWIKVINRMLMKDPDDFQIHRLRIIHLYKADYSLALALHWRETLHHAEDANLLNDGTYGSRPNRSALTPVLMEELMLEITRLTRKNLVMFDNDATSCYDRIVAAIMSIISRHYGAHKKVVVVWARTLEAARFHLKTGNNVSPEFYQHCQAYPIHGSGQGATNAPCGWLFICSKLFDIYEDSATGATFISPDRSSSITIFMIGFVDDTKNQTNDFAAHPQPPMEELLETMSEDAQLWHDLLSISGGALELRKCTYHAVSWFFNKRGFPIMEGYNPDYALRVQNNKNQPQMIKGLSSYKEHKTLGHYKYPSGSTVAQKEQLQHKANEHASFLKGNYLSKRETYVYYSGMYLPSITYPLANSFLTRKQLESIEKRPLNAILSKTGFNSKMHRSVVFGPVNLGGKAFRSLYVEQGCLQIKLLMTEMRRDTTAGKLLFIALQWMQYASGIGTPLLEATNTCHHSESKWLKSIQEFLVMNGLKLQFSESYVMPLQRENDRYIMDAIIESGQFSLMELELINHVRLYLQVLSTADITNGDGTRIREALIREDCKTRLSSTYIYINQENPPSTSWKLWTKAIALFHDGAFTLKVPLGDWTVSKENIRMQWEFYSSASKQLVYRLPNFQKGGNYSYTQKLRELPHDSIPTDGNYRPALICHHRIPRTMYPLSFYETLLQLDKWERDILTQFRLTPSTSVVAVCQEINNNNIQIASDGSVQANVGTFGWVIATKDRGIRLIESSGWTRGSYPSSYRSEILGGLSVSRFLYHFIHYFHLQLSPATPWYCDNESLVTKYKDTHQSPDVLLDELLNVQDTLHELERSADEGRWKADTSLPWVLGADWDVLNELLQTKQDLPLAVEWIKSHQDRTRDKEQLDVPAQLNCRADQLATSQHKKQTPEDVALMPPMKSVPVQLVLGDRTITSHHINEIRQHITSGPLLQYIQNKNHWTPEVASTMDWHLHSVVVKKHKGPAIVKFLHQCLPTQRTLHRRNQALSPVCVRCGLCDESDEHIIMCSKSQQWRQGLFDYYLKTAEQYKCDRALVEIIVKALQLHAEQKVLDPTDVPARYRRVISQQKQLGWHNWYKGRISREFYPLLPVTGEKKFHFLKHVLTFTLGRWQDLWNERNKITHGATNVAKLSQKTLRVHAELEYIYSRRNQYLQKDKDILLESVEEHKKLPSYSIQNWILLYKDILSDSAMTAKKLALQGVQTIKHYFSPT